MNLDKFNLNLFVALDAVLHASSLTEAARRLHLTQPALSIALKKVREAYGDDIVLYGSGAPVLTPMGEALRPRVKVLIQAAKDAMKVCPHFDPSTTGHAFRLSAPDILELVHLQPVLADVVRVAPRVRLCVEAFKYDSVFSVLHRGVDLAVVSEAFADPQFSMEPLFDESFKCVVWDGNERVGDELTQDQFFCMGHVDIAYGATPPGDGSHHDTLRRIGRGRRVVLQASSQAALPHLVVGTELIATTLSRYADACAQRLPVRVLPFPFDMPPTRFVVQWQPYRDSDPALVWMRDCLQAGVRRMGPRQATTTSPLMISAPLRRAPNVGCMWPTNGAGSPDPGRRPP